VAVLKAISDAPNAEVVAIASRSLEKAAAWGAERGIPEAYGSCESLTVVAS
jgi:predicted dehydrogenase